MEPFKKTDLASFDINLVVINAESHLASCFDVWALLKAAMGGSSGSWT